MLNEMILQKLRGAIEHLSCADMMVDNDNSDQAIKAAIKAANECIKDCIAEDQAEEYLEAEARQHVFGLLYTAKKLVARGVELMTTEQVSQWEGARDWQESV